MSRYAATENSFALLSIRPKRSVLLEQDLAELQARLDTLSIQGVCSEDVESIRMEMLSLRSRLDDELATQERQRQENIRRRHNYVPFIMTMLKHLAKRGQLQGMVERAQEKKRRQACVAGIGGGKK